jgi:hypothetical protein
MQVSNSCADLGIDDTCAVIMTYSTLLNVM